MKEWVGVTGFLSHPALFPLWKSRYDSPILCLMLATLVRHGKLIRVTDNVTFIVPAQATFAILSYCLCTLRCKVCT